MKKFIFHIFIFASINVLLFFAWYGILYLNEPICPPQQSISCIQMMSQKMHYDVLVLGTSHGRTLSVSGNHDRVEKIIHKKMINLSKSGGAGPLWAKIFIDLFYDYQNDVDVIIYFIDPWVFSSSLWNEDLCAAFISEEPFRFRMFLSALNNGVDAKCLHRYVRSYLLTDWTFDQCDATGSDDHFLTKVDDFAVRERLRFLYPGTGSGEIKEAYFSDLRELVKIGKQHGARTFLIMPPTLLGDIPLMSALIEKVAPFARRNGIQWYDYSRAISDPALFTDHDHLNSRGIEVFVRRYIDPLLHHRYPSPL